MADTICLFLLPVLAFIAPTLAFASVNRTVCTAIQIVQSLMLCLALGLTCGTGLTLAKATPLVASALALVISLGLSERMLCGLLPKKGTRRCTVAGILAVGFGLAWISPWILACLYGFHIALSAHDLRKNWWQQARYGQFPFEWFECGSGLKNKSFEPTADELFQRKPNIHVLFLESIHSSSALRAIYGTDDFGLEDSLKKNAFTVCNALSSNTHTVASLFSLLHMMPWAYLTASELDIPEAFTLLKKNGYSISVFDSSMYVFRDYIPWIDHINFDLPALVKRIYALFMPFFAQSRFARALVGGADVYLTDLSFSHIRDDFKSWIETRNTTPQCTFVRFGAEHSDDLKDFDELKPHFSQWDAFYTHRYQKSAENIGEIISLIDRHDPDACILVLGDHGATKFRGCWGNEGDPNQHIAGHGLYPALVGRDLCDVLVAMRLPSLQNACFETPVTHANLLRDLFTSLGCKPHAMSPRCQALSILLTRNGRLFLVAKQGKLLEQWQALPQEIANELAIRCVNNAPNRVENHIALARYATDPASAAQVLHKVYQHFPASTTAKKAWLKELLRQGRASEANAVLPTLQGHCPNLRYEQILLCLMENRLAEAHRLRNSLQAKFGLNSWQKLQLDTFARIADGKIASGSVPEMQIIGAARKGHLHFVAFYSHAANMHHDSATTDRLLAATHDVSPANMDWQIIRTSLHARRDWPDCDWAQREKNLRSAMSGDASHAPLFTLWLAGILEQQGRIKEAAQILLAKLQQVMPPELLGLTGLFFLRHHIDFGSRETELLLKRHAYATLDNGNAALRAPLFDEAFYIRRYSAIIPEGMPPIRHFLEFGLMLGLDPNPAFDTVWNILSFPSCAITCSLPLADYMASPIQAQKQPCLTFWPQAWLAQHPECRTAGEHPLVHYLNHKATP